MVGTVTAVGVAAAYFRQPPTIANEEDLKRIVKLQIRDLLDLTNPPTLEEEEYPAPTDDIGRGDLILARSMHF